MEGWTINIALISNNRPILGVVYAPCFYELYIALKGGGSYTFDAKLLKNAMESHLVDEAFLESHKIHLNGDRALEDKELVACDSNFHSTKETQEFLQKYHLRVRKYGSSLKVCALAKGEADLYPRFNGTSEWDMAACDIVLQEAGGEILDCITKNHCFIIKRISEITILSLLQRVKWVERFIEIFYKIRGNY